MDTSYDLNSTPKTINQNKYIESLMDFSTPMSTISNNWINNSTTKKFNQSDNNQTIIDKLLQKFHKHKINFSNTQKYLYLLDDHLHEITIIINQLKNFFEHNSLLKTTTDQLETRLLQISIKREQIHQTFNDIIQQISPSTDLIISYTELINIIKLSINKKIHLIEYFYHKQNSIKYQTNNYHLKIKQRQELLMKLIENISEQQKINEIYIEKINQSIFDHHTKQLIEFNKLNDEYQLLQNENHLLKQKIKENIQILYTFINQITE